MLVLGFLFFSKRRPSLLVSNRDTLPSKMTNTNERKRRRLSLQHDYIRNLHTFESFMSRPRRQSIEEGRDTMIHLPAEICELVRPFPAAYETCD
jgi:hypothetical protein